MFISLNNSDWLARFLRRKKFKPIWAGFLLFVINLIGDLSMAFAFGAFFPSSKSHGFAAEPIAIFSDLVIPSFLIGFYCWIQYAPSIMLKSLFTKKIIEHNEDVEKIINDSDSILKSRWVPIIAVVLGIIGQALFISSIPISDPSYVGWISVHPLMPWIRTIFNFITYYISLMFIFDVVIIIWTLFRIFNRQDIQVKPFHPDKAGGLGAIGSFSANLGYLIGIFGLEVSISLLSNTQPGGISTIGIIYFAKISSLLLYIVLAPIIFFVPLHSAHKAMVKFRDTLIGEISEEIEAEYSTLRELLREGTASQIGELTQKIDHLREINNQYNEFPTWPFNQDNLKKFFGFTSGAIVPGVISVFIDVLGSLIRVKAT